LLPLTTLPLASKEVTDAFHNHESLPSSPHLSPRRVSTDSRPRTDSNASTNSTASLATAWNAVDPCASPKQRRKSSLASPVFFRDGPLPSPPLSPTRPSLVDRSNNHGFISRQEAEARLKDHGMALGMYLLREKEPNKMYALSVVVPEGVKHHLIEVVWLIARSCRASAHVCAILIEISPQG
jgi:hypothetical protein